MPSLIGYLNSHYFNFCYIDTHQSLCIHRLLNQLLWYHSGCSMVCVIWGCILRKTGCKDSSHCANIQQRGTHWSTNFSESMGQNNSRFPGVFFPVMGKKNMEDERKLVYLSGKKKRKKYAFSCFPFPFREQSVWCLLNSSQLKWRLCLRMEKGTACNAANAPESLELFWMKPGSQLAN